MPSFFDPGARELLERRIAGLAPDAPRRWGRMSAHQAVCHLADSFGAVLGDVTLTRPDVPAVFGSAPARFVALTLPLPWPKGVATAPEMDQEQRGTPPGEYEADVARLRENMHRFARSGGRGLEPHIVFGPLGPGEWGRWGWRHVDHHLRQFGA